MKYHIKALRPEQWLKSGFCLAALFFSGQAFEVEKWLQVLPVLITFSLIASAGYVFNDLWNRDEDRQHPRKRNRAIASGKVSGKAALALCLSCIVSSLLITSIAYGFGKTSLCLIGYILINSLYTVSLRKIPILDIASISFGFVLRVAAGAFALTLYPSEWLMLITYLLALLLALGKRAGELKKLGQEEVPIGATRNSLNWYARIDASKAIWVVSILISGCYLLYCYKARAHSNGFWLTAIPVLIALVAYSLEANRSADVERPEKLVLKKPIIALCMAVWMVMVIVFVR